LRNDRAALPLASQAQWVHSGVDPVRSAKDARLPALLDRARLLRLLVVDFDRLDQLSKFGFWTQEVENWILFQPVQVRIPILGCSFQRCQRPFLVLCFIGRKLPSSSEENRPKA